MLEWRKWEEVYNSVDSMILGLSAGVLLVILIGDVTGWEAWMPVGMVPEGIDGNYQFYITTK